MSREDAVVRAVVWLVIGIGLIVVAVYSISRRADCERSRCDHGDPRMIRGICLCVEVPKAAAREGVKP